jgi:hypothetical protein
MDIQKLWPDINNSRRQMPYHATAPMRKTLDRAVIVIYPCMDAACFETNAQVRFSNRPVGSSTFSANVDDPQHGLGLVGGQACAAGLGRFDLVDSAVDLRREFSPDRIQGGGAT